MLEKIANLSVRKVASEVGLNELGDTKRSVRLVKRAGIWADVHVGNDKGPGCDSLAGYFEKRALVKEFEKKIDEALGPGEGKRLTKQVGAYNRSVFAAALPKLNGEQIQQLNRLVDTAKPPPGMTERRVHDAPLKWTAQKLWGRPDDRLQLKAELQKVFQSRFETNKEKPDDWDGQFLKDLSRSNISLGGSSLRDMTLEEVKAALLKFTDDDKEAARNLASLLVQNAIGTLDASFTEQTKLQAADPSSANALGCQVFKVDGGYTLHHSSSRNVSSLAVINSDDVFAIDPTNSKCDAHLAIRISHDDLKAGTRAASKFTSIRPSRSISSRRLDRRPPSRCRTGKAEAGPEKRFPLSSVML